MSAPISITPPDPRQLIPPADCAPGIYCHALYGCRIVYGPIVAVSANRTTVNVIIQGLPITLPISAVLDLANGPPPYQPATPNSFALPLT